MLTLQLSANNGVVPIPTSSSPVSVHPANLTLRHRMGVACARTFAQHAVSTLRGLRIRLHTHVHGIGASPRACLPCLSVSP